MSLMVREALAIDLASRVEGTTRETFEGVTRGSFAVYAGNRWVLFRSDLTLLGDRNGLAARCGLDYCDPELLSKCTNWLNKGAIA